MSTKTIELASENVAATERIAEHIGSRLKGGECIELISDLGGGKTTFTRGLALGSGSADNVASPTFTISRVYKGSQFDIHHFDFYRLMDAGLAAHELHDLVNDDQVVIVVEWGGVVEEVLPDSRLSITITASGEDSRKLIITIPDELNYLVEDI